MTAHTVTLIHTHTLTAHTHTRITHTHTHSTLTPLVLHGDSLHTQLVLNPRTRQSPITDHPDNGLYEHIDDDSDIDLDSDDEDDIDRDDEIENMSEPEVYFLPFVVAPGALNAFVT